MIQALQYIKYENIFKRQVDKSFLSQFILSIKKKLAHWCNACHLLWWWHIYANNDQGRLEAEEFLLLSHGLKIKDICDVGQHSSDSVYKHPQRKRSPFCFYTIAHQLPIQPARKKKQLLPCPVLIPIYFLRLSYS